MNANNAVTHVEPDQEEANPLVPCSCGNEEIEILWCDDTSNSTEEELLVFAHCGNCGATGPDAVTNSGGRNPLAAAERTATFMWNQHRTATLEMAMELLSVQLMFRLLQNFSQGRGKPEELLQDPDYLEIERVYRKVLDLDGPAGPPEECPRESR